MADTHKILRTEAVFDLPASLTRDIGRIIVKWSYVEHKTQQIIRVLAQLTVPIGRIIVREPRLEDRITMIEHLAEFIGISLDEDVLFKIKRGVNIVAAKRHALAHGFWIKEKGAWCIAITRGQWDDDEAPSRNKSILPEAIPITPGDLKTIVEAIERLDKLIDIIGSQVLAKLQPPPELHPSQYPRKSPKQGHGASTRARQPQSSPQSARRAKKLSSAQRRKMMTGKTRQKP